jgi:CubicO group peptidase (beta-lactamase class C family)
MFRLFVLWFFIGVLCRAEDSGRMDQVVQSFASAKTFMGSVLVARGGDVLFSKGYGLASLEWDIPNSPQTKFRLGSITQQFTAAAILLLEERGRLKVEDPVRKYLPDAPAAWEKITIFNLLTHTSGIPDLSGFPDYFQIQPLPITPERLVARFRDKPLEFTPGEHWHYSTSGYLLLGYLIEKISGESYEAFVKENLFSPVGMNDSGYDSSSAIISHHASGYIPSRDGPLPAGFVHMSVAFSAGGLYSTTGDLLRWEQGLFGGRVLSRASLQKMTTPFKEDYAFGLSVRVVDGHRLIEHGGDIEGFNAHLAYYPDDRVTVVVLANLSGPESTDIAGKLGAIAHGQPVELTSERKEIALPVAMLAGYVGTYELAPQRNMLITLDGKQLLAQLPTAGRLPIFAQSEKLFFLKAVDAQLEFGKDAGGAYAVLHQYGHDLKAVKTSDAVEGDKEIAVPRTILEKYVGVYELRPGLDLTVTLEGDQLTTQISGQPKIRVYAASETKFFPKAFEAEIEFRGNTLILRQGGHEVAARRK